MSFEEEPSVDPEIYFLDLERPDDVRNNFKKILGRESMGNNHPTVNLRMEKATGRIFFGTSKSNSFFVETLCAYNVTNLQEIIRAAVRRDASVPALKIEFLWQPKSEYAEVCDRIKDILNDQT